MPKKDITGLRFGKLTALRPTDQRHHATVVWECRCDCGNVVFLDVNRLTMGHTRSCGCNQYNRGPRVDLTNQRFGRLTVLRMTNERRNGRVLWECQCDCGNTILVPGAYLRKGHRQSCGCLRKETAKENCQKYKEKYRFAGTDISHLSRQPGAANTSGVVGVAYDPKKKRWTATITFRRKTYSLGCFKNKTDAIAARKKAEEDSHDRFLEKFQKESALGSSDVSEKAIAAECEQALARHTKDPSHARQGIKRDGETLSQYVGVTFHCTKLKWFARIQYKNKFYDLGAFDTEVSAAKAYDKKAKELYGETARLNFQQFQHSDDK
jgi:hypothetical protein